MDRAEQLESRIRWRISRHFPNLPVGRTFFYEQLHEELRGAIAVVAQTRDAGRGWRGLGWLLLIAVCWYTLATVVMHAGGLIVFGDDWLRAMGL